MEESAEERKEKEERKLKYWEMVAKAKYDKESSHERLIVYVAAGAISVLIAFIQYKDGSINTCYLLPAWVLLVGTLIFALLGIACSIQAHNKVLEEVSKPGMEFNHKNSWDKISDAFFVIVPTLLVLGIIAVSLFIYGNLGVK